MDLGVRLTDVLSFFFPTLFAAWPLFLLVPLGWRDRSLRSFAVIWCFLALVRFASVFFQGTGLSVIPEPLSTALFLAAGALIVAVFLIQMRRRK